jgi:hypothetical protein
MIKLLQYVCEKRMEMVRPMKDLKRQPFFKPTSGRLLLSNCFIHTFKVGRATFLSQIAS